MPQQSNFHSSNYQGNQPGHDASLRADATSPSSGSSLTSSMATSSQYRGKQSAFQPTGNVQSFYQAGAAGAGLSSSMTSSVASAGASSTAGALSSSAGSAQSANSYHAANYKGNQPGHDASLRSDASSPSGASFS